MNSLQLSDDNTKSVDVRVTTAALATGDLTTTVRDKIAIHRVAQRWHFRPLCFHQIQASPDIGDEVHFASSIPPKEQTAGTAAPLPRALLGTNECFQIAPTDGDRRRYR